MTDASSQLPDAHLPESGLSTPVEPGQPDVARAPVPPSMIGATEYTIDDKDRLVLPPAFRESFAEGVFIHPRTDYVTCYTPESWENYRLKLIDMAENPAQSGITGATRDLIFESVSSASLDKQGRVKLPASAMAALRTSEVRVGGAHNKITIRPAAATMTPEQSAAVEKALEVVGL